ncbi:MAG: AGE family epimerase/isomerase [Balneolaceae bacterium]
MMNERALLKKLKTEMEQEFNDDLVPYWTNHAIDEVNGGFIGQITYDNQKNYDASKGVILNARLLWAFSATCKIYNTPDLKRSAKRAYEYLLKYFLDKEYGGFYWIVNAKGIVEDDRKHIYAQAFCIYGLVEYFSFTKDRQALKLAYDIFHLIENNATDSENGGYFEAYNRKWELNGDVRLSDKDENEPKSMNTHLHILEAYTNLYRFAPNDRLKVRLEELVHIFCDNIISTDETTLVNFMDVDWSPKSDVISYGHNIEASWLLLEAAEVLNQPMLIERIKSVAINLSNAVLKDGVDVDGGLLNEASSTALIDPNKDWWPQAEAIIGFLNAYELSGEVKFLEAAINSWEFIKRFMFDEEYGEWYEKVSRNGTPFSKMDKVRSWKGPYHNMRAVIEIVARVERITKESLVESNETERV